MEHLEAQVLAALRRVGYASENTRLVVAVSGGPDSMALLHALVAIKNHAGLKLHVAHLNHDFRGDEAAVDARFVAEVADNLALPSTIGKADPAAYQKESGISSFEEAAREVRYSFLSEVAAATCCDAVALGHNSDDLAETVLMHIIRGSGSRGLRGMMDLSTWVSRDGVKKTTVFRPLLGVSKENTLRYCADKGIVCRKDSGNVMMRFTRNKVRHNLLPYLEEYNPKVRDALARLSRTSSLEADYLEEQADRAWAETATMEEGQIVLDAPTLRSFHPAIQRLALSKAYEKASGSLRRLEESHLVAATKMLNSGSVGSISLPKGLELVHSYNRLVLGKDPDALCPFPPMQGVHSLTLPSTTHPSVGHIPGWKITITEESPTAPIPEESFSAHMDGSTIEGGLHVRTRRPGDRFHPLGANTPKKLQDFYVDQKVPQHWRDKVPLVVAEGGIAWVVGYRPAQWAKVSGGTVRICSLRFEPSHGV